MSQYGRAAAPPAAGSIFVFGVVAVVGAFTVAQGLTNVSFTYTMGAVAALILFALAFVRTDFGIYVVIFSMLLSPQFGSKGAGVGAGRGVTFRTEDFVLLVIGLSWLAKTAVNKELNLIARTPLNWPILTYIAVNLAATMLGYMTGTISSWSGYFYVLKYVEYFVIYYMAVNNLRDREHAWRLIGAAFITAAIVSVIGLVLSPGLIFVAPKAVKDRVTYTFKEEKGSDTVRVGKVAFDPSTSARLISFKSALDGFARRPIFGWGVTGFGFMDAQYARVLAETGLVGLAAFLWLMWAVGRHALDVYATRGDPEERGLVLGFLAGFAGLLVHGFGSNTFIIVRIMEPFWLITGIVMMIPALEAKERAAATAAAAQKAAAAAPKKERAGARP